MKVNASTYVKEELLNEEMNTCTPIKQKSYKTLRPLYMPDVRRQIIFQIIAFFF